jgi:small GTP-binding protein
VEGRFFPDTPPTLGGSFTSCDLTVENTKVLLHIWDTAGSEKYQAIAPIYYRDTNVAMIVYDITSTESFEQCRTWYTNMQDNLAHPVPLILVGNKTDLESARKITTSEANRFVSEFHLVGFFEPSALDGTNVVEAFTALAGHALAASIPQGFVPPVPPPIENTGQTTNCCGGSN